MALSAPFAATTMLGLNMRSPKLADRRFREAIGLAVDRRAVVRLAQLGRAVPMAGLVPFLGPAGGGGDGDGDCGEGCAGDREAASRLVAEVFPGGAVPEISIDYPQGAGEEATAVAIEANLEAAGIPANRRSLPIDEYRALVARGEHELFQLSWVGAYPSSEAYLAPLFGTGAAESTTGFESSEVDGLLAAARRSGDAGEREAAWAQAEALIVAEGAAIPLLQHQIRFARASRVAGFELGSDGTFAADQVRLAGGR